jgi:hypothetical protein
MNKSIEFLKEFKALLEKYDIDNISADDEWQGYAECGQDIRIRIDSYKFVDGEIQKIDLDFGQSIYPKHL